MLTNDYSLKLYMADHQETLIEEAKISGLRKANQKQGKHTGILTSFVNMVNKIRFPKAVTSQSIEACC